MTAHPSSALPAGTLTFLFTDIEGSTRLLVELGQAFQPVLLEHDRLIEAAVAKHGGRVFGHEGDASFSVFTDARSAVAAAVDAQRAVIGAAWPDGRELRVRMGLHTGDATPTGDDYVGQLAVHQAARIAAAGHGGQILLSEATRALAAGSLPPDAAVRDLGEHRLKDLARPERLHELVVPGLPDAFPALKTLSARPNNLPLQLTSFVGRAEIDEARRLLAGSRLLTLTGPGGTGKTRLGLQLAAEAMDEFPDGTWFVPLDAVDDPELVPSAIARALGIDPGTDPPLDRVIANVHDRRVLLLLDNFEQVIDAAPVVSRLLRDAADLKIVVTSRIVLRVSGEQEFAVPPLSVPPPGAATTAQVAGSEAAQLFVERAAASNASFRLDDGNADAIAEIVRRLDGLPLAVELAAVRVRHLPVEAIRARLDQRLGLLTGGSRDLPARQQTLRGAIDWSYDLLETPDRRLFERFAVFAGGSALDQVDEICGPAAELGQEPLDGLSSLTEKSLLRPAEIHDHEPRFAMLATIREYATERLTVRGEADDIGRRHATAFLALAEAAAPHLTGSDAPAQLSRLEADHENLRTALDWFVASGDAESAFRLAASLWRFWQVRGHLLEAGQRFERVLAMPGADALPPAIRARALGAAGSIAYWRADIADTKGYYTAALEAAREANNVALLAEATYNAGFRPVDERPDADGRVRYEFDGEMFMEAIRLYREIGDLRGEGTATWALAGNRMSVRDLVTAREHLERSIAIARSIDDPFGVGWGQHMLGLVEIAEDRPTEATPRIAEALGIFRATGDLPGVMLVLLDHALVARAIGDPRGFWLLAAAGDALGQSTGSAIATTLPAFIDFRTPTRPDDDPEAARWWDEGRSLSLEDALAVAAEIAVAARSGDQPPQPS